ncbi:MAG: pyruvate synthase subunit PorA [Candidatus Thermoplasmatota archaeon]|nr:pyruvate synthase subunit PorA [Candidatus Thermoplasmatota archaeon]
MGTKQVVKGNFATAVAAKLVKVDVVPAYPITPSTLFPEQISTYIANGEMDAELLLVESEHSAMSAAIGASASGARVATATASQGLKLMSEMLFIASGMRLPIVTAVGNRALSAPINIWCDHQDTIAERDSGWLQFYAENNQNALDLMIMAFKISEDHRVLLPSMVGLDAFVLTHTMEGVDVPLQEEVDKFLPPYKPVYTLDVKNPITFGSFGTPAYYTEFKYQQWEAMKNAEEVIDEVFSEFYSKFSRKYEKLSEYRTDDADIIFLTMGSMSGTARAAVDKLREKGIKVGAAKLTVFRPFPFDEIKALSKKAKVLAVVDRNISFGFGGAVFGEVAGALINEKENPILMDFILGLGGRDVTQDAFSAMTDKAEASIKKGKADKMVNWINLKGELRG